MQVETRVIKPQVREFKMKTGEIPTVTQWKSEPMIRIHSIRATVKEILNQSESLDLIKINIVGNQSTGKTTLARTLGHLIHSMSEVPFAVKIFSKDELLDFQNTISKLSPTNYVLVFDDVSFLQALTSKKQIEIIKQGITEIRHLPGGQDVKIILIFNTHYTKSLDKYIRMADFEYYSSVGSEEIDNLNDKFGKAKSRKLTEFRKLFKSATGKKKFSFKLGSKGLFTYKYKNPFVPLLFWNGESLRVVVSPKREWIDKICSICSNSDKSMVESDINLEDLVKDFNFKFGIQTAKTAVKIKLFQSGINAYSKRVQQAMKYLEKYLTTKTINLEELATSYNMTEKEVQLHKKLPEGL